MVPGIVQRLARNDQNFEINLARYWTIIDFAITRQSKPCTFYKQKNRATFPWIKLLLLQNIQRWPRKNGKRERVIESFDRRQHKLREILHLVWASRACSSPGRRKKIIGRRYASGNHEDCLWITKILGIVSRNDRNNKWLIG